MLTYSDASLETQAVAKRLQLILPDSEYLDIRRAAQARRMSVADWIRQALTCASRQELSGAVAPKLEAIRAAAKYSFPTGDIDAMLDEIEEGYSRTILN